MSKLIKFYFGRSKPAGGMVKMQEIQEFINGEVATQYEGFNVNYNMGFWQGRSEESFTIEVIAPALDFRASQIANVYKTRFGQDTVLITTQNVELDLV